MQISSIPDSSDNSFGLYVRGIRKAKKLTTTKLAELSGISSCYISQFENGKRGIPSKHVIRSLALAMDIPFQQLIDAAYGSNLSKTANEISNVEVISFCQKTIGELNKMSERISELSDLLKLLIEREASN